MYYDFLPWNVSEEEREEDKAIRNCLKNFQFDPYKEETRILPGDILLMKDGSVVLVGDVNVYLGGCCNCSGIDEYTPTFKKELIVGVANIKDILEKILLQQDH